MLRSLILLTALLSATANASYCYKNGGLTICLVDIPIKLVRNSGDMGDINDRMANERYKLDVAMNAGMYKEDLSPMGLLVIDGKQLAPLNTKKGHTNFYAQPNGVFYTDSKGAWIKTTAEYKAARLHPDIATQSGPMLIKNGEILQSSTVSPTSQSMHHRNAVCTYPNGDVAFVITNHPMTMYYFAAMMQYTLACESALYLDGVVSAMYAPNVHRYERGVKDAMFLVVDQ